MKQLAVQRSGLVVLAEVLKTQRMLQADSREKLREIVSGAVLLLVKDTLEIAGRTL